MRKKQSISFSVPKPCSERWDDMTANEQGRHCTNCNKTVIDFSLYSDAELLHFFKMAKGNICGRINSYQVNRLILIQEQTNRSSFYKLFMGTALASWLGLTSNATAQNKTTQATTEQGTQKKLIGHISAPQNDTTVGSCIVKGFVYDSTTSSKEPLPFVNVVIETNDSQQVGGTTTDIDGKFTIVIPVEFLNQKLKLVCVYIGYKDRIVEFRAKKNPVAFSICMVQEEMKLMGDIIMTRPFSTPDKTTFDQDDSPTLPPRPH